MKRKSGRVAPYTFEERAAAQHLGCVLMRRTIPATQERYCTLGAEPPKRQSHGAERRAKRA